MSDEEKSSSTGLTFPQIAGAALAAATAAVLGSFLGVVGTIGGAALVSIVSTVGSSLYQRSLERTRDKVKERLVVGGPGQTRVAGVVSRVTGVAAGGSGPDARTAAPTRVGGQGGAVREPGPPVGGSPGGGPSGGGPSGGGPAGHPPWPPAPRGPAPDPRAAPSATGRVPGPEGTLRAGGRTVAARVAPPQSRPGPGTPGGAGRPGGPSGGGSGRPGGPAGPGRPGSAPRIPEARTGTPPGGVSPTAHFGQGGPGPRGPGGPSGSSGPGSGADATTALADYGSAPAPARRGGMRKWLMLAGLAVSIFAIGLLASMGVEAAAGRPLSGGSGGTSVGSLFGQPTGPVPTTSSTAPSEGETGSPDTSTTSPADRGGSDTGRGEPGGSTSTSRSPAPSTERPLVPDADLPGVGSPQSTNG